MSMSHRIIIAIPCNVCGARDGHYSGCLKVQLDHLDRMQKHIGCPKCFQNTVDLNTDDFYECRQCHTQYTTGQRGKDLEKVMLIIDMDAPIDEGARYALVLPEKGTGQLKIDLAIAEVRQKIDEKLAKRSKKKRKK